MRNTRHCDFLVGGAGIAGICAAIQAGRLGLRTILVEKEMLLGGNGGPLLGVGATGAMDSNPYWNETGIIEELEERVNYSGARITPAQLLFNINPEWDTVVSGMLQEAGVIVLRRHLVRDLVVEEERISRVIGLNIENLDEVEIVVEGYVLDSTGDAHIAARAGADTAMGRESKEQTGERSAPDKADEMVSAASITALTVDTGRECAFTPPPGTPKWNPDKPASTFLPDRAVNMLWQVDEGGDVPGNHPLYSPQELYLNLVKRIYSLWDYIKNILYPREAGTHQLIWISPILGRRESRRIVGDYLLTQTDIEGGKTFADAIGFGGFYLDEHPPSGDGGYETRFHSRPLPYDIPFRCIYSRNIKNLFSGGRAISASHLAFTSTRVIRTTAVLAQAAAIAAKECIVRNVPPRLLGERYPKELQQAIIKQDGCIIGVAGNDPADIARQARVRASSEATVNREPHGNKWGRAGKGRGVVLYRYPKKLEEAGFYVRNKQSCEQEISLFVGYGETPPIKHPEIENRRQDEQYVFHYPERQEHISEFTIYEEKKVTVPANFEGWVKTALADKGDFPGFRRGVVGQAVLLAVKGDVEVRISSPGVDVLEGVLGEENTWLAMDRDVPCFFLRPDPVPGQAKNLLDGYIHREGRAHLHQWMSRPGLKLPQWIELDLREEKSFNSIQIRFDTTERFREEMYNIRGEKAARRCVADYRVEIRRQDEWKTIVKEKDNYRRFRSHRLNRPVCAQKMRLVVERVWGDDEPARIYEIRLYEEK